MPNGTSMYKLVGTPGMEILRCKLQAGPQTGPSLMGFGLGEVRGAAIDGIQGRLIYLDELRPYPSLCMCFLQLRRGDPSCAAL